MVPDGIYDLLAAAAKKRSLEDKIVALHTAFKVRPQTVSILKYALKDGLNFILPEGTPPYTPTNKDEDLQSVLPGEVRKLHHFIAGNSPGLRPLKREKLFIDILESVDPDDAKLLIDMKDKKLPFGRRLTKSHVKAAFPVAAKDW